MRKRRNSIVAITLLLLLSACGQAPSAPPPSPPSAQPGTTARALGTLSLDLYIGNERNQERPVPLANQTPQRLGNVRAQGFPGAADVTFSQATYTMRVLGNPERWTFTAAFKVTNNSSQVLQNLTMIARNRAGQSLGETAISRIQGNNGSLTTDPALARGFEGINTITHMGTVIQSSADMQALRQEEAWQLESAARTAGALPASDALLNYGFVIRRSNTSRTIPPASCKTTPQDPCNTGTVSVTFKTPAFPYTGPASIPSFPLKLTFESLLVSDGPNRVTRSEETTASAVTRAQSFGANAVTFVGNDGDTASPLQTVRVPFVNTASLGLSSDTLTAVEALPQFQALGVAIDRDYALGTTEQGKTTVWFPDQTNTALFFALLDNLRVEQLLRFKPVGAGFEVVNVLDGRGFVTTEFASLLDANNEVSDTAAGFTLQAKFAQLIVKNPNYFAFPGIKQPAASNRVQTQGGSIPPVSLVELSCAPCVDKATVLIRDAGLFFGGLISGGIAIDAASKAVFFKTFITTASARLAMSEFKTALVAGGVTVVGVSIATWAGYDSVVGSGNAYYACIATNCPPNLVVFNPQSGSLTLRGRVGTTAQGNIILQANSASGFGFSLAATRGQLAEVIVPIAQVALTPELPGILYGNQLRSITYSVACSATPSTFSATITVTWPGPAKTIPVSVDCSGAVLEPPSAGEVLLGVGSVLEGIKGFRNIGNEPLTYTADVPNAPIAVLEGASGTVAPGGTASLRLRFACSAEFGSSQVYNLVIVSNGGTAIVPIRLTCVGIIVTPVSGYNGPQDDCARVKAVVTISSDAWVSAGFNVFINGVRSTYTDIVRTGQNTFQFNLTRACNLTTGSHSLLIRFSDAQTGVVTERGAIFIVNDNRWPGVVFNDTNRCGAALGITLDRVASTAPGETLQEATNILPGRAVRFLQRRDVVYRYQADGTGYIEIVNANFNDGIIDGSPAIVDGKVAYWGVYFSRGVCGTTQGAATSSPDGPNGPRLRGYFKNLSR
jgi:hypothetical protein